jgi:hypothetical protein
MYLYIMYMYIINVRFIHWSCIIRHSTFKLNMMLPVNKLFHNDYTTCQVSHWTIFDLKKQHETILTSTLCICKLAIGEFKSEKSYIDYVHVCSPKYEKLHSKFHPFSKEISHLDISKSSHVWIYDDP